MCFGMHAHVALGACLAAISQDHRNWAHSMFKAIRGIGYQVNIRCDDLDHIDIPALILKRQYCRSGLHNARMLFGMVLIFARGHAGH